MGLEFFGIAPETDEEGSPTVWADLTRHRLVIRGDALTGPSSWRSARPSGWPVTGSAYLPTSP